MAHEISADYHGDVQAAVDALAGAGRVTRLSVDGAPYDVDILQAETEIAPRGARAGALDPSEFTVDELKDHLQETEYTSAELADAIKAELAGENRDTAVRALKQARDAAEA